MSEKKARKPRQSKKENTMSEEETAVDVDVDVDVTVNEAPSPEAKDKDKEKRERRLSKDIVSQPGKVLITVADGVEGQMSFDSADLPEEIRNNFVPFGISHKLGDSAAGHSGVDAEKVIKDTWAGLVAGDWTIRAPAAPKVSLKDVAGNFSGLSEEDQEAAKALMLKLGIKLPGITQ